MYKILPVLFLCFFLASCAAKSAATVATPSASQDKEAVLQLLKERTREFCAYEGKVRVGISGETTQKASGLLKVDCDSNASLTVLGPFGIVLEELTLKDGVFSAASGEWTERDTSSSAFAHVIKSALRIPPMMPKPHYSYADLNGSFLFEGDGYRILVDDTYKISGVEALSYKARYTYLKEMPTSASVSLPCDKSYCTTITVDFLEEWK